MMTQREIEEHKGYVSQLKAAQSAAEVGKVYEQMVGYDLHEDDPTMGLEEIREFALDYVAEHCYESGTHCTLVGLDPCEGYEI